MPTRGDTDHFRRFDIMTQKSIDYSMYFSGELFMRSRKGWFGVYFPNCAATREINTQMTPEWAH